MLRPYYDEDSITLYCGDCREILPEITEPIDLLLSDPPYGIAYDTSHDKYKNGIARRAVAGDAEPFDPSHLLGYPRLILWGGNCFASRLPDSPKWLVWCKTMRDDAAVRQADIEIAWTNCVSRSRIFHHLWIGAYKDSESGLAAEHPTQKPLALMKWCIGLVKDVGTICDPYAGSGTTLRAAKDLNRRAIGIEIDERYCEITARKLAQGVLQF